MKSLESGHWFGSAAPVVLLIGILAGTPARAALYDIPYNGGKQSGSVVVAVDGTVGTVSDTIRIGGLEVRLGTGVGQFLTVCGYKPPVVAQFAASFGTAGQTEDMSADWNAFTVYPAEGLIALDSVPIYSGSEGDSAFGPGFEVYKRGQNNSCEGEEYSLSSGWNRVVFLRFGSGVDYRAKLSFRAVDDTSYVGPPSFTNYHVLRSLRLDYVINANSTDLAGPTAIRAPRGSRIDGPVQAGTAQERYNPLGVRLRRAAHDHEVVIPLRRR